MVKRKSKATRSIKVSEDTYKLLTQLRRVITGNFPYYYNVEKGEIATYDDAMNYGAHAGLNHLMAKIEDNDIFLVREAIDKAGKKLIKNASKVKI